MKKLLTLAFAAILFSTTLSAQSSDGAPASPMQSKTICSSIDGSRYEILTSGIPEHKRYRIDKVDGTVWIFYTGYTYTNIKREQTDLDVQEEGKINYQLYIMGDGSNSYLMNLNTGAIWYYEWHLFRDDEFKLMK